MSLKIELAGAGERPLPEVQNKTFRFALARSRHQRQCIGDNREMTDRPRIDRVAELRRRLLNPRVVGSFDYQAAQYRAIDHFISEYVLGRDR